MNNRTRTTDEQTWAILTAPDHMNAQQLADQLGLTYTAVRNRRWQLRKHGWSCRVSWDPCQECGDPLIRPTSTKRYHDRCRPLVSKRLNASYEPARQERMTAEQRATKAHHRDDHYDRSQANTIPYATSHFRRYTPEDDAILLELSETMTIEQVALEIGRTRAAAQNRLHKVRKRGPE